MKKISFLLSEYSDSFCRISRLFVSENSIHCRSHCLRMISGEKVRERRDKVREEKERTEKRKEKEGKRKRL